MEKYWDIVNIGTYSIFFGYLVSKPCYIYSKTLLSRVVLSGKLRGKQRLKMTLRQTFVCMWFTGVHSLEKCL